MKHRTLQQLSKSITSGITPFRGNPDFWLNGTIPWLKTEQLGERNIYNTNESITEKALSKTSIRLNPINTISIAMYGEGKTRGNVSIIRKEMTTNQACCNVVLDQALADPDYVYYFLKNQYQNLRSLSSGVRKNLNSGDIKGFTINLPETLAQQKGIARVLSVLDDKIELNNRINEELEGMAKLLYDYWFVQFDFPITAAQAAAMGKPKLEGKPYRASGGKMIYNEALKREIPEGWGETELGEICRNIRESVDPTQLSPQTPYVGLEHVPRRQFFLNAWDSAQAVTSLKNRFEKDDVLFGKLRPYFHKVVKVAMDGVCSSELLVLRAKQPKHRGIVGSILFSDVFVDFTSKKWGGAQMPRASWELMSQFKFPMPPDALLEAFDEKVLPCWRMGDTNEKQNQQLTQLRDWLLPMLMNGQVTVG